MEALFTAIFGQQAGNSEINEMTRAMAIFIVAVVGVGLLIAASSVWSWMKSAVRST